MLATLPWRSFLVRNANLLPPGPPNTRDKNYPDLFLSIKNEWNFFFRPIIRNCRHQLCAKIGDPKLAKLLQQFSASSVNIPRKSYLRTTTVFYEKNKDMTCVRMFDCHPP